MQVNEETFYWLRGLSLLSLSEGKRIKEDTYSLGRNSITLFENGQMFAKILKTLSKLYSQSLKRPEPPFPEIDSLKEVNTPAARLYNWTILQECYKRLNIHLSAENKGQIVSGNHDSGFAFLRDIISSSLSYIPDEVARTQTKLKQRQKPPEYKEEIDVSKVDISKDLQKCKNCIEFFVILLSRHLSLPPTQTASLFTHTNKYLAHLFAKGVKGLYDPIINFYQDIHASVPQLLVYFKEDPTKKNMHLTMNALKPGLVSKSFEVSQWCAKLFSRFAFEFGDGNLLAASWDWFVSENGGLSTTLLGLRRHPDLKDQVVSILLQFSRFNFIELFTIHMKKAQPDPKDLLSTYVHLLKPLTEQSSVCEEFLGAGILDEWVDYAIENASDDYRNTVDVRVQALALLTEVWKLFPYKIEENEYKSNTIMTLLTKACKDKSMSLLLNSLGLLFELLIYFGISKSQFAPGVYRTLTLCLIENHSNVTIRQFILNNFSNVFEQLESIPLNILVEPLVRQIQVTDGVTYFFNVFDFQFFSYISNNDRLQLKNAIQILDLFFKIYLNSVIFAQLASVPILNIIHKYIASDTLIEFVIKFIKVALAIFYASEKKKKPKDKSMPLYNNKSAINSQLQVAEIENEIVAAQKRALIVEMIKGIVAINSNDLNDKIKPLVAHTNIQIKQFSKSNSKGMISILSLFGSAEQILEKYEIEYNQHQQNVKQDKEKEQETIIDKYEGMASQQSDILKAMEENLKKYKQLSKAEALHLAMLRLPNADPKILKNLQELKNNFKQREETKQKEQETKQEEGERIKNGLRKALVQRSLQQGVSCQNQKDMDGALLFQFGSREKQKKDIINVPPEIKYYDLDKEEERDREMVQLLLKKYQKLLKNIYVKYSNSGFSQQFTNKSLNNFDHIKDHSSVISNAELYKFIKDYELNSQVSQEEHESLVRIVAISEYAKRNKNGNSKTDSPQNLSMQENEASRTVKQSPLLLRSQLHRQQTLSMKGITPSKAKLADIMNNSTQSKQINLYEKGQGQNSYAKPDLKDVKQLDYNDFLEYLVQFACNIYSRYPYDMGHLPLSATVQKLFDHMRGVTLKKKQSTLLYDEADTAYFGESDVIKEFNKQLEQDPDYVLPKGYKKIKDKQLLFDYGFDRNKAFPMSDALRYSYDILNDIFKEQLNFYLLEPKSVSKFVVKAIPLVINPTAAEPVYLDVFKTPQTLESRKAAKMSALGPLNQSVSNSVLGPWGKPDSTKTIPSTFNYKPKYGEKRVLEVEPVHKLDLGLKLALSNIPFKDKPAAEQVAYCLDDIIKTIENGSDQVVKGKRTENVIVQERKLNAIEEEQQKVLKAENFKKGHELVQQRAKQIEEESGEQKREKKEKEENEKAQKEEQKKRKNEEIDQFWKGKKEILDENKQRKEEENKRLEEEKQQEEKEKKLQKERDAAEFVKKQVEKQLGKFDDKKERDRQKEEEKKAKEEQQKQLIQKLHLQSQKANSELVGQDKENNQKIKALLASEEVQKVLKKNEFKINQLFQHLQKFTFREVSRVVMNDSDISFKTFNWFCNKFNLFPGIIPTTQDIAMIFNSVIRNKQSIDFKPIGQNEQEFKEALLRMAVKGKNIFNKFSEQLDKGVELDQDQMNNIAQNENQEEENTVSTRNTVPKAKQVIDQYNLDQVSAKTLEALIYYLGLPNDKIGIGEALKNAIETGSKPNNVLKQEIREKIKKDPKELMRYKHPEAQFSNISNIKLQKNNERSEEQQDDE